MPKRKRAANESTKSTKDLNHSVLGGLRDPTLDSRISGNDSDQEEGVDQFSIPFGEKQIICEKRGGDGKSSLIFTHGAGGGVANPATKDFAAGFALTSPIICFQGTMNLQNRVKTFHATVDHQEAGQTALGGRSMGARAAVKTALERKGRPSALVLVSYPLTGGKKGEKREQDREKVLEELPSDVDVLFIFGSDDAQCQRGLLEEVIGKMSAKTWLLEVAGADHSMSLKDKQAVQRLRMWTGTIAARWLKERDDMRRFASLSWNSNTAKVAYQDWRNGDD